MLSLLHVTFAPFLRLRVIMRWLRRTLDHASEVLAVGLRFDRSIPILVFGHSEMSREFLY